MKRFFRLDHMELPGKHDTRSSASQMSLNKSSLLNVNCQTDQENKYEVTSKERVSFRTAAAVYI